MPPALTSTIINSRVNSTLTKSNFKNDKMFRFLLSTIEKSLNNRIYFSSPERNNRIKNCYESEIHNTKIVFIKKSKEMSARRAKKTPLNRNGISTMNQMRTIESFTDDGFSLLESYYGSIEMELTKIITQISLVFDCCSAIQCSLIIAGLLFDASKSERSLVISRACDETSFSIGLTGEGIKILLTLYW